MTSDAHFFRIGLFIILGSLVVAGAMIVFGIGQIFRPRLEMVTYVPGSVQGIDVGSPVKFRGVTVGRVQSVEFLFTEYPDLPRTNQDNMVVINMQVEKEVFPGMFSDPDLEEAMERAAKAGLRARIEPQGITGLNYIEVNYVDAMRYPAIAIEWKPRALYIPSAPGEITSLLDSVNNIMREIEELNIQGISDGTVKLLAGLNDAVEKADIAKLSAEAQKLFNELSKAVESAKLGELSASSEELIQQIGASNQDLQKILANVEPASRLNADDINAALANLKVISDNLRVLSADLAADPSSLIFSRPPRPASIFDAPTPQNRKRKD